MERLTKTSSSDQVTSTLTKTADRVNYAQSWFTSLYLPPRRRTSMREETLANIPRLVSTAPVSSTMTTSGKGYSLSLTTKGALIFLSRCCSTSTRLMAFPSLASPTSDVGRMENTCCHGGVAKIRGDHDSVQRGLGDKNGNRIG